MAGAITLEVATPERLLLKDTVREVQIPAANGAIGVLPEHAPLISELGEGPLVFTVESGLKKCISVCGGFVEVLPDHVRVLAYRAEPADEIDAQRAEAALKRALDRLSNPPQELDVARAMNAMKRAQARLAAVNYIGIAK